MKGPRNVGRLCLGGLAAAMGAASLQGAVRSRHWAFQEVREVHPPRVQDARWVKNPIDAFVLARLEAKGLSPSAPADKITLLRRASLDLTGLPPTPEQVESFLKDGSEEAFATVLDRLLESPRYGERWARHWLDLARYAESEGFKADETRPNAWRYRDYVIKSLNQDKPYDRFVKEQIAGDELWPEDPDALVATAFNRHYPDESNARNLMQRRQEILNDITDTVGAVFTGLTVGCAKCHDHKYDPITQKDYYSLQAFFANAAASDSIVLKPRKDREAYLRQRAVWEARTKGIREAMAALEAPKRQAIIKAYVDKYPEPIRRALAKAPSERSPFEAQMVAKAMLYLAPQSHQYLAPARKVAASLKGEKRKRWNELDRALAGFEALRPDALPVGTGIHDLSERSPATHVLGSGRYDAPREEVQPALFAFLNLPSPRVRPIGAIGSTGRRAALAALLVDPRNPLTARVMVNRIWHYHFGRGIVRTPSDFGTQGAPPTHPKLLDWLAVEFIRQGWSLKQMHRLIMLSHTYQQSGLTRAKAFAVDPENRLFWRFPRRRLEGETIRDAALAVSGLLNLTMGGPSVFPELPPGMTVRGGWDFNEDPADANRRSIYVFVRRNTRYPFFESFDMPDTHQSCAARATTTSPVQALHLLNGDLSLKWARAFAGRVLRTAGSAVDRQIDTAYRIAYSRGPSEYEKAMLHGFFERQQAIVSRRSTAGKKLALPLGFRNQCDPARAAVLVDFCQMLMDSNEFVYLN